MTFRIERPFGAWSTNYERAYKPGETLECEIGAWLGLATQPATLESLAKGKGFIVGNRVIRPSGLIWTNRGYAIAT